MYPPAILLFIVERPRLSSRYPRILLAATRVDDFGVIASTCLERGGGQPEEGRAHFAAGEERDLNVMAKGRREDRMKRGTEEVKRANERASGATREISGCAIDWRADDANAQPTSTSVD
ncbi:hypothetical protein ALC57_15823 [Trachymyrmex cornetzi]|uniref:Uncharacterized protein n=1 Tax=Trachymyrmex cornetzi TaxID=471704 RepID=A0A151IW11_9HYME|nr:hypothetical protein ALC57_15823 [Trachymyrmex cornetzi]